MLNNCRSTRDARGDGYKHMVNLQRCQLFFSALVLVVVVVDTCLSLLVDKEAVDALIISGVVLRVSLFLWFDGESGSFHCPLQEPRIYHFVVLSCFWLLRFCVFVCERFFWNLRKCDL